MAHDHNNFDPLLDWEAETVLPGNGPVTPAMTPAADGLLDDDAEHTALPLGLLDSSSCDHIDDTSDEHPATPIQRFIDTITAPSPVAALPLPHAAPSSDAPPEADCYTGVTVDLPQHHCSERERQRLALQSGVAVSGDPAGWALAVQIKKWGGAALHTPQASEKKKKLYLSKYTGPNKVQAQQALDDLLLASKGVK